MLTTAMVSENEIVGVPIRSLVITLFLFFSTLVFTGEGFLKIVGYISLLVFFIAISIDFVLGLIFGFRFRCSQSMTMGFAYLVVVAFGAIGAGITGAIFFINVLFYLILFACLLHFKEFLYLEKYISYGFKAFAIISIVAYIALGFSGRFSFIYSNSNAFGLLVLMGSYFILFPYKERNRFFVIWMAVIFTLIYFSGSRSALGAYIIILVGLLVRRYIFGIISLRFLFIVSVMCFFMLCYAYVEIKGTEIGNYLNLISQAYLEKNMYSGRQDYWSSILDSMNYYDFLFGKGSGLHPSSITHLSISAHNSYLQILFQNGVVSVLSIVLFFYYSIPSREEARKWLDGYVIFLYAIAINFCAIWEVFLFQNHPILCVFMLITFASAHQRKGRALNRVDIYHTRSFEGYK